MGSKKGQLPPQFMNMKIPWGPIGKPVFLRSYSHKKSDGLKETWPEAAVRVVDGNLGLVLEEFIESDERDKLLGALLPFGIMPAGRHLNASGVIGRQFLFNCHASGWSTSEPEAHFSFLFDQLMQGGGVGANYSNRYLESLPKISRQIDLHIMCRDNHPNHAEVADYLSTHNGEFPGRHIVVEDSREGWVQAVDLIVKLAFLPDPERVVEPITFDVSRIRQRGAELKTSGGIACGPEPLVKMLSSLVKHLNGCFDRKLSSLDAMVIDHALSSCVIAGGKRRSSRMSVKNWKDPDIFEFINCKRQDGAHWTTNISVEIDDEFLAAYAAKSVWARRVMKEIVLGKRLNGEPGIWNRSYAMKGERDPELMYCPNPCGEIGLQMWENCNLGHINMEFFAKGRKAEMLEAFRLMARWLIRATFGDIPQPRQRAVVNRNRRIGVGIMGLHAYCALNGLKYSECHKDKALIETLRQAHRVVRAEATRYAKLLGIPDPVKTTALAPVGSTTSLPGTTNSGQAMVTPWFKRLVRYSDMDPELEAKRKEGYEIIADEDAQNTSIVIFWCEDPLVAKVEAAGFDPKEILEGQYDISFEDSLRVQAMLQDNFADNAISFTVNLKQEGLISEEIMEETLVRYLPRLKGTTVFVDKSRKNSPIQPVTKSQWDAYTGRKEVTQVEEDCKGGCPVG